MSDPAGLNVPAADAVVRGNEAGVSGGGILNWGSLTMTGSVVWGNRTDAGSGGGIVNLDTLTLSASVVRGNTTGYNGGGIVNWGSLTLRRSSWVTANTAGKSGGGIWNNEDPDLGVGTVIVRGASTVTGNTPDDCFGTTAC